jgi:hypothetical protein
LGRVDRGCCPDLKEPETGRRKNWSAEPFVAKLRQIEVQLAQGKSLALACNEAEL